MGWEVHRDLAQCEGRYWLMDAPTSSNLSLNCISVNLPNRDELLLRSVLALPVASRIGLAWTPTYHRIGQGKSPRLLFAPVANRAAGTA